jgi:adenylate kinase family enzyme
MNRILILGPPGSGKSTLAKEMNKILDIGILHIDTIFWKEGWIIREEGEYRNHLKEFIKKESWIIDGNYSSTLEERVRLADVIVYLDIKRFILFYRVIKRRILNHNKSRDDIAQGCKEKIDWGFIKWIWQFEKRNKINIMKVINDYGNNKSKIIICKKQEYQDFLRKVKNEHENK